MEASARPRLSEADLLDRNGRPLRGAARAARLRKLERERSAATPAPRIPGLRVARPAIPRVSIPRLPFPSLSLRAMRLVAITTVMTFVFATVIGTSGIVAQRGTVALGASTTLSVIRGEVEVSASPGAPFVRASDGELLRAGMTVRTAADAYAVLTYFEGSTVSLDPSTTLVIEALAADPDGSTTISMQQVLGRTWHSVSKLVNARSKYDVRTPTAVATVRGTIFEVDVASEQGEVVSTVKTAEGAVATSKAPTPQEPAPAQVVVTPGLQVTVRPSAPLPAPVPQPEPERSVQVSVGAAEGLVVDPQGRANGVKDGKLVVQTPGAQVRTVDGKVVVTFREVDDGKVSTLIKGRAGEPEENVKVTTVVREKGSSEKRSEVEVQVPAAAQAAGPRAGAPEAASPVVPAAPATAVSAGETASAGKTPRLPPAPQAVTAVELRRGEGVVAVKVSEREKAEIAASVKVPDAPRPKRDEGERILPSTIPPLPVGAKASSATEAKSQPREALTPRADEKKAERAAEAQKGEAAKDEAPKPDVTKGEAPKPDVTKADAPKAQTQAESPKRQPAPEKPKAEEPGIVPSFALPAIPVARTPEPPAGEAPRDKKEEPKPEPTREEPATKEERATKEEAKLEPRFELPKIELPDLRNAFGPRPEKNKSGNEGRGKP